MKYMLLIFGNEKAYDEMDTWPETDLAAMRDFTGELNDDLIASGEFVQGVGLAHPGLGRTVRATASYLLAARRTSSLPERAYLQGQAAQLPG
jgi:hypothetical protein